MKNIMLLDDAKSGGVVYVNKTTYDQALLLSGRLDGDPKRVEALLKSPKTAAYVATIGLKGLIEEMMASMPKPLNMLAPFLMFCVQNQGITWDSTDRVFAYGILHQYSMLVDFNAITLVPVEVRNNIVVATSILKAYQSSWDDLCSSLRDNVVLGGVQQVVAPPVVQVTQPVQQAAASAPTVQQSATPAAQTAPAPAPTAPAQPAQPSGEQSLEERMKAFQERMAREAEEEEKERKEKAAKRAAKANESKPAPTPAAAAKPVATNNDAAGANKVLDEFDFD